MATVPEKGINKDTHSSYSKKARKLLNMLREKAGDTCKTERKASKLTHFEGFSFISEFKLALQILYFISKFFG